MVDGYEGYSKACEEYGITRLGCMAHVRRKFMDVKKANKSNKAGKADVALADIKRLYTIEAQIKGKTEQEKLAIRQQQAKPILDKLKKWLEKSLPTVPPKSLLGKALQYMHNQWPRISRYVEDGAYPIDNNAAENAIRPFAIGRKNWLFSKSQSGAKASANIYSIIETAKANGLAMQDYLQKILTDLPNCETVEEIEALLPWNVKLKK